MSVSVTMSWCVSVCFLTMSVSVTMSWCVSMCVLTMSVSVTMSRCVSVCVCPCLAPVSCPVDTPRQCWSGPAAVRTVHSDHSVWSVQWKLSSNLLPVWDAVSCDSSHVVTMSVLTLSLISSCLASSQVSSVSCTAIVLHDDVRKRKYLLSCWA